MRCPGRRVEEALEDLRTAWCARARAHLPLPAHARTGDGVSCAAAPSAGRGCRLADADRGSGAVGAGGDMCSMRSRRTRARARAAGTMSITGCSAITRASAPAAHGKLSLARPQRILRTAKPKQPREYQEQVRRADAPAGRGLGESSCIAPKDLPFEFMLNSLRLNEGFSVNDYRQTDRARTGVHRDQNGGGREPGSAHGKAGAVVSHGAGATLPK